MDRIERMGMTNPLWVDVTWNAGGSTSDITLDLCSHIQNFSGLDVLMHITCTYMTRDMVLSSLDRVSCLPFKEFIFRRKLSSPYLIFRPKSLELGTCLH